MRAREFKRDSKSEIIQEKAMIREKEREHRVIERQIDRVCETHREWENTREIDSATQKYQQT